MKIKGLEKEITTLKHFKVGKDEYIICKDNNIFISLIDKKNYKLILPDNERKLLLKNIILNFIQEKPDTNLFEENECTTLDNEIKGEFELSGSQNIYLSENQINNLINYKIKKNNILDIICIIILIILFTLFISGFIFIKSIVFDKKVNNNTTTDTDIINNIEEENIDDSTNISLSDEENNEIKKFIEKILQIKSDNINEYALLLPEQDRENYKKSFEFDNLNKEYGSDYKKSLINFTTSQIEEKTLDNLVLKYSKYTNFDCYNINTNITISGSIKTENKSIPLRICKLDGIWYLIK